MVNGVTAAMEAGRCCTPFVRLHSLMEDSCRGRTWDMEGKKRRTSPLAEKMEKLSYSNLVLVRVL
jgi:hypothetical protein